MFKLFKGNNDNVRNLRNSVAEKIYKKLRQAEDKCVQFLKKKTDHWSYRQWKIALVIFCLAFGAAGVDGIVDAFRKSGSEKSTPIIVEKKIITPPLKGPKESRVNFSSDMNDNDFQRLTRFDQFLDSLSKTDSGKKIYDSIVSRNPGLRDSVRLLEQMYREKKK